MLDVLSDFDFFNFFFKIFAVFCFAKFIILWALYHTDCTAASTVCYL